ncbi:PAS domain S-box protein [Gemmata sp.]|uniref:PAS domain S-box protein n=1 Tax=Gemmata sp. TaxID=1914242 RepID=UPI003F713248
MTEFADGLFDTTGFVPRAQCGAWTPSLIWLHVVSDLLIWVAYVSIPVVLLAFSWRKEFPFPRVFRLFALFILACGFVHLVEAVIFFEPIYRFSGVLKAVTAAVSLMTVAAMVPLVRRLFTSEQEDFLAVLRGVRTGGFGLRGVSRWVTAVWVAAVAALVANTAASSYNINSLIYNDELVTRALGVKDELDDLLGDVTAAEAAGRGFQVTGSGAYFAPFSAACRSALRRLAGLGDAVADSPAQAADAAHLRDAVAAQIDAMTQAALARALPGDRTALAAANEREQRLMDEVRATVARMAAREDAHLGERATVARNKYRATTVTSLLGGGLALGMMLAGYGLLRWELGRRLVAEGVIKQREAELARSEAQFRTLAAAVPQIVWVARPDGGREYYNAKWYEYTGMAEAETLGWGWVAALHPDDRERTAAAWRRAVAAGTEFEAEYRLRGADGAYRWFLSRALPQRDEAGAAVRWFGSATDITDRRAAEEAVKRSERNLADFFENASVGLHWAGPDGTVLSANRAELEMLGCGAGDYVGRPAAAFHEAPGGMAEVQARLLRGERVDNFPARLRRADGTARDVLISSSGLWEGDRFIHSRTFTRDVTEQKRAEVQLAEREARYRTLTEAIPQIVWNATPDGTVTYLNQRWLEYTRVPLEVVRERGWLAAAHPDDDDRVRAAWRKTLANAAAGVADRFREEVRLRRGDTGEYRWFLTVAVPLHRADGTVDQWIGSMADVHDQRTAAEVVRESEEKFRQLAESIPQLAWMTDPDGSIFWYNQRWYDYTGTTPDQMLGWGWRSVLDPADAARVVDKFAAHVASGEPWEDTFQIRRRDGAGRWHLSRARPIRDDAGRVVRWFGTNTDVTEQRELEHKLRAGEERFRTLTEAVPQMVWTADPGGAVTFLNRRWAEYTGAAPGGRPDPWPGLVHPDDAGPFRAAWDRAVAHQPERFADEFRLRRAADGQYRWMLATAVPLRDPAGAVTEWVGSVTDIDDQKRQAENLERMVRQRTAALVDEIEERRRVEERVRAVAAELARSNAELEQFAYVASHDLQEPLRKIQAFGDRLKTRFRDHLPDGGRDYVDRMLASAGRMRQLIDDLLTFSRVTTQARAHARLDVGGLVREVVSDLSVRIEQTGGEVRVGDLPDVEGDPTQMRQLFQNLIANAVKFHRPGVRPLVEVWGERVPADGDAPPRVRYTVRDNGIGFDTKYADRIFQVFQRLHGREEYEGTGVGLAICRKILERHGGTVTAEGRVGAGATFVVTVPVAPPPPPQAPAGDPGAA